MKSLNSNKEMTFASDTDQTLVMWSKTHRKPGKGKLKFKDPYTDEIVYLTPHKVHIRLLKQHRARGFNVVVWSAAGKAWADTVVDTLGIRAHVNQTMAKPIKFLDDKNNIKDILGTRVYLEDS